jgi:ribonuclease HII
MAVSQLYIDWNRADAWLRREAQLWNAGFRRVAGIDEAGRGPLAGPVVAAAVIFPVGGFIDGVDDSKRLSPRKREILIDRIREKALFVGIGQCSPAEIDEMNILQASLEAMKRAVDTLPRSPDHLLIDGRWELPGYQGSQEAVVKGDQSCFSVAAASIVAKVTRDRIMREYHAIYPQYGFDRHKGYPSKTHREAIKKYGYCDIHRRSFKVKL